MTLQAGTRLGAYEILSRLGAGVVERSTGRGIGSSTGASRSRSSQSRSRPIPIRWPGSSARRRRSRRSLIRTSFRPAGSPTAVSEAWLLGALGEIDDAFDVLARAEEEYQGLLCYTGVPGFDSLRADPRFGALLERLELPPARATGALS